MCIPSSSNGLFLVYLSPCEASHLLSPFCQVMVNAVSKHAISHYNGVPFLLDDWDSMRFFLRLPGNQYTSQCTPNDFDQAWDWLYLDKFSFTWPRKTFHHKSHPHSNFDSQYTSQHAGDGVLSTRYMCTKGWTYLCYIGIRMSLLGNHTSLPTSLQNVVPSSLKSRLSHKRLVSNSPPTLWLDTNTCGIGWSLHLSIMLYEGAYQISHCMLQQCIPTLWSTLSEDTISFPLEVSVCPPMVSHLTDPCVDAMIIIIYMFQYQLKVK